MSRINIDKDNAVALAVDYATEMRIAIGTLDTVRFLQVDSPEIQSEKGELLPTHPTWFVEFQSIDDDPGEPIDDLDREVRAHFEEEGPIPIVLVVDAETGQVSQLKHK